MLQLVASKYLHDDGELDSAINSEWAEAYGISLKRINRMEKNYLSAMVRLLLYIACNYHGSTLMTFLKAYY